MCALQLANHRDKVRAISAEATQEAALEGMLRKVQDKWMGVELTVKQYKEAKDAYILGSLEEVQAVLEDSLALMATVLSSRFVSGVLRRPVWHQICESSMVCERQGDRRMPPSCPPVLCQMRCGSLFDAGCVMKLLHVRKKDYAVGCGSQNMNQWHPHPLLQLKKSHGSEC